MADVVQERPGGARPLLVGSVINGSAAAVAMWLAGRALGLQEFAPLAQLWTLWGLAATGLVFGFQQWEISRHGADPAAPRSPVPRSTQLMLVGLSVIVVLAAVLLRERVFGSDSLVWPLVTGTLPVGTACTGLAYATLARTHRFGRLGGLMAAENTARLALTIALVLADAPPVAYAATVPVGFAVTALPLLVGARSTDARTAAARPAIVPLLSLVGFMTTFVVMGGPVLLGTAGGPAAAVSALFLVLIPIRVPFLLANSLLPRTMVQAMGMAQSGHRDELQRWGRRIWGAGIAMGAFGALGGWFLGDALADLVFGTGGILPPSVYGFVGATAGLCLAATFLNVVAIAVGRTSLIAAAWALVGITGLSLVPTGVLAAPTALGVWMVGGSLFVLMALGAHVARASDPGVA